MALAKLTNIGIAGSKGFIGSHLINYLSQRNITYVCFNGNALNKKDVNSFFLKNKISQIIFLIGTFNPPFSDQFKINVLTLQNFLNIGIEHGLKKIIFLSTGAVYGEPKKNESLETDILEPNTLYGLSKTLAEKCILFYAKNYGLKFIILRLANVYGKNKNEGVIHHFILDIEKIGEVTIKGNGNQTRQFIHVNDVCLSIEKSLHHNKSNIFNISNSKKISINDLAKEMKKKYSFSIKYEPKDNNLSNLCLNIEKARKILNFKPKITKLNI